MQFQHLNLKVEQMQEEITQKREKLEALLLQRASACVHEKVVKTPFKSGTFIDSDELRVCEICGTWELGFHNTFTSKLHPTRTASREEVLGIRQEKGLHGLSRLKIEELNP